MNGGWDYDSPGMGIAGCGGMANFMGAHGWHRCAALQPRPCGKEVEFARENM